MGNKKGSMEIRCASQKKLEKKRFGEQGRKGRWKVGEISGEGFLWYRVSMWQRIMGKNQRLWARDSGVAGPSGIQGHDFRRHLTQK